MKRWGATGLFEVDGEYVVVKHACPVVYPHAAAVHRAVERAYPQATAELLAHDDDAVWQRSVFAYVSGPTVETVGPAALVTQARTLGEVQSAMADVDLRGLPQYDLTAIPETLLADLSRVADLDDELVAGLRRHLPALQRGIEELTAAVPISIDHPDIQGTNGLVRDNESVVLLDWEEARVGCPMISLDRLRQEADEVGNVPEVLAAYLDALPWGTAAEKRHLADIALQVAPLKLAVEAREYARIIGLPHPHTRYVTTLVTRSLSRLVSGAQLPG
ncbi:hypothetical protein E0H75_12480 [Kribbella capetownensis]|uniref:Aminoglycoside phosphotransferase family protein n=1 Tax=Kribbella capetownensis TaxID=1572659 RepID=A0A4R0JW50_9ACTN|nr:hypothetical protein [Kribbella capetownensis]TCC50960.1 hypothetical protein E0H75_12480 [Kribbella capetownensis]